MFIIDTLQLREIERKRESRKSLCLILQRIYLNNGAANSWAWMLGVNKQCPADPIHQDLCHRHVGVLWIL